MTGEVTLRAGPDGRPGPSRRRRLRGALGAGLVVALLAVAAGGGLMAVDAATGAAPAGEPQPQGEVPVTATNLIDKPANNSPQLAVDPTEEQFVALANRRDGPGFDCALQVSGDGGRSWVSADPVPVLPEGAETCYAPEVVFDSDGTLYYLFVGLAGSGNQPMGVFLTRSTDRGRSFDPPKQVLGADRYQVRLALDRQAGDPGRLHLVWLQAEGEPSLGGLPAPPNPIMATHSDDGGETWSEPVQVSDPDRRRVVAPALAVGAEGAVHVAYYDLEGDERDYRGLEGPVWEGTWTLVATTSRDGGATFGDQTVVDDGLAPPGRVMLIFTMAPPALVADDAGNVYTAWHDARHDDWDVFLGRSRDAGRSWDGPVRVNDTPVGDGSHQHLPQLTVSPGGRVEAIFYDRRGTPDNRGENVSYTYSTDRGESFAGNTTLTAVDFDSRIGPRYAVPSAAGQFEFGSRIALAAGDDRTLAAWTDTRNTGRGAPAQDVYATTVAWPQPGGALRLAGVALGAAGLAGLAAVGVTARRRRGGAGEGGGLDEANEVGEGAAGVAAPAADPVGGEG